MPYPGVDVFPGSDLFPSGPYVSLQVAWGRTDLSGDPESWTWTDITSDVRTASGFSWRLGRSDESSTANPAELSVVLANSSYAYSLDGRSANYPYVRRNTPVRLLVDPNDGGGARSAYLGFATSWEPSWDSLKGDLPVVKLTASGTLRRLAQGSDPVISPMRRHLTNEPDVVAYWPCEEGKGSNFFPAAVGSRAMTWSGIADLASSTDFKASLPLPKMNGVSGSGGSFAGVVDTYTPAVDYSQGIRTLLSMPDSGITDQAVLFQVKFTGGTLGIIQVLYRTGGNLEVRLYTPGFTTLLGTSGSVPFSIDGKDRLVSLEMFQSGGTLYYGLNTLQVGDSFYTSIPGSPSVSATCGLVSQVEFDPAASVSGVGFGHVAVLKARSATDPLLDVYKQLNGWPGEQITGAGRLQRLCDENTIRLDTYDVTPDVLTAADYAGSQAVLSVVDLLHECEVTERGVLWDGLTPGLAYTTRRRFENASPALTIDASALQLAPPFGPVDDDQRTRNRWTVTRRDGATFTSEDSSGPSGTDVVGVYPDSLTVNSQFDTAAPDIAGWLVHQGTVQGYRYPSLSVDLRATPSLAGGVLDLFPGARVDVTNLSSVLASAAPETVSLTVEGISHDLSTDDWKVTLSCSPFDVWRIGLAAGDTGDIAENLLRLNTDGSTLTTGYSAGATSVVVDSPSGPLWTTAADDYPLAVDMGGVRVNATACSGPTSSGGVATVRARASGVNDTASTSHSITLPTTVAGDLLLVAFTNDVASVTASTVSTGWATLATRSQGAATTAQLGQTSDSGSSSSSSANKTVVSSFVAATTGTVTAGHARLWVDTGTAPNVSMVVYADSAGVPGALLGSSSTVTLSNTSEALIDFTWSSGPSITSGTTYWIGFTWPDPGTNSVFWSRAATASLASQNSSNLANPFGAATTLSGPIDAYVDVTTPATNHTSTVFWKRATGSDALTVTTSDLQESTHISLSIYNALDPEATSNDGASSTTPATSSISPSGGSGDYLAVVVLATDSSATTSQSVSVLPSGYGNLQSRNPGTTSSAATFTMEQSYTGVSSITPGSMTISTAEQWITFTVAVKSAPLVYGTTQTMTVDPLPVARTSGSSVSVWRPPALGL